MNRLPRVLAAPHAERIETEHFLRGSVALLAPAVGQNQLSPFTVQELTGPGPAHPPTAQPPTAPTQPAPGRGRAALLQLLQQHTQGTGPPAAPQPGRDAPIKHHSPPTGPRARGQPSPPLRPHLSPHAAGQQRPSAGAPLQSEAKHGTSGVP